MPEWLSHAVTIEPAVSTMTMAVRIAAALLLGVVVALAYRMSHGNRSPNAWTLFTTIVLLSGLLAMISMVIGESVARAFGLVGALSIVRFRTVVEDTRDTAFVIFAVIVGMAVGTGLLLVAAVGVPLIGVVAVVLSRAESRSDGRVEEMVWRLGVRLAIGHDPASIAPILVGRATVVGIAGVKTARQGSAVDVTYRVLVRDGDAAALVLALNAAQGVQEVELLPVESNERIERRFSSQ